MNRSMQSEVSDLTARQMEILALVSKGCSNIDIAQLLNISPNTVKAHIATILERLHVSNRTEASVLYEKQLHTGDLSVPSSQPLLPFIDLDLIYKGLSRTAEIAENLSQLLHGFEILSVHSQTADDFIKSSKSVNHGYLIKIDDLTEVNADLQIALFVNDLTTGRQELLYKTNHPLAVFDPQSLVKYAVEIYHQVLKVESASEPNKPSNYRQLCEALLLCEAVSIEQLQQANQHCDLLLKSNENWHLPHAIKSFVSNKIITNGWSTDVSTESAELTHHARRALSLKPTSAWSQLAFAYFCALSSDLKLAKKHLQASLNANPCQYRALQLLGQIYAFEGRVQQSIDAFNQLLINFPSNESKGLPNAALALVHYCAEDYARSKKTANRALMYEDAPKVPMIMTLISIAELELDQVSLHGLKRQLLALQIDTKAILKSLAVAEKIVPPDRMQHYIASLTRAGVV